MKRSETEILNEIHRLYNGLSPENLACDGEATRAQMKATATKLRSRLKACFKELGREVPEGDFY